jgi:hypothetical protein
MHAIQFSYLQSSPKSLLLLRSLQGWLEVIIELSGKPEVGFFSSLFKQWWTNNFASPTNYGGCQSPIACKINKTKENSENKIFGDFQV